MELGAEIQKVASQTEREREEAKARRRETGRQGREMLEEITRVKTSGQEKARRRRRRRKGFL